MKRGANIQLTQENHSDEGEAETGSFKRASEDIIQKRIIKPLKKKSSDLNSSLPLNPLPTSLPLVNSTFITQQISGPAKVGSAIEKSKSINDGSEEMARKVKGLNTDFLKYITKCTSQDCFADLSMICHEYTIYLSKIEKESLKKDGSELGPLPKDDQKLPLTINFGNVKKQDAPLVFSFSESGSATPKQKEDKPVFNGFGTVGDTTGFGFKSMPTVTESSSFKFGNTVSSFGKAEEGDFSFAKAPSSTATPISFNFTKSNGIDKPLPLTTPFSFQPVNSDQKGSIFPNFSGTSAPTTGDAAIVEEEDNDIQPEEQVGDALMVAKAGEEDEETLFSVRSKLRKFVDNKWEMIGLGLLKVNQNKSSKNSRIILRSESGKVLLNVSIFSGMTVTIKENTSVNFAASLSPGSLTTLSAKVKEKNDATALQEAIERAKLKS